MAEIEEINLNSEILFLTHSPRNSIVNLAIRQLIVNSVPCFKVITSFCFASRQFGIILTDFVDYLKDGFNLNHLVPVTANACLRLSERIGGVDY